MKGGLETGMNIRHFETPAVGGFMLTYETAELSTCFTVGEECDVFRCEADLLDKIQFYLENPVRRREIAKAGQERTLREHLYSHRIGKLVDLLCESGVLPKTASAVKSAVIERRSPGVGLDAVGATPQGETSR
jgi:spore maturation protein CgeB